MLFYQAVRTLGVDVDVRHPDDDLGGFQVIIAPCLQLVDKGRAAHFAAAAQDALFVAGPRTGFRTMTGRVQEEGQPGPMGELLGCKLLNFDGMRPGLTVKAGGHVVETWAEAYRLAGGRAVITYEDGPLEGEAAVVWNGNAITIGAWSQGLVGEVMRGLFVERGIPVMALPDGVRVSYRGKRRFIMNFNERDVVLADGTAVGAVASRIDHVAADAARRTTGEL